MVHIMIPPENVLSVKMEHIQSNHFQYVHHATVFVLNVTKSMESAPNVQLDIGTIQMEKDKHVKNVLMVTFQTMVQQNARNVHLIVRMDFVISTVDSAICARVG